MIVEGDEVSARDFHLFNLAGNCRMWSIEDGDHLTGGHKTFYQDGKGLSPPTVFDPSALAFLVSL
jgi:hypothetical protein